LNEWLAKDVATVACSGNMNQDQFKSAWYVQEMKYQWTPLLTWIMLNVYAEDGQFTQKTRSSAAGN